MSAQRYSRSIYVAGLCALLGAAACTDGTPVGPSSATAPREARLDIVVSNPAITLLSLEIGGGKVKQPLLYDIPLVDGRSTLALSTPASVDRQLVARGYDAYGTLTHQGSIALREILVGKNEPLALELVPTGGGRSVTVSLDVVGEALSGGGSIVVESGAKEILAGQTLPLKATLYDRDGRRLDVDPHEIHWAVSDPRLGHPVSDAAGAPYLDATQAGAIDMIAIWRDIYWKRQFVVNGDPYVQIAAGFDFTCGRRTSGAVSCWGDNAFSQLGNTAAQTCFAPSTIDSCNDRRVLVSGGRTFASISSGRSFVCGIETNGHISCWGKNDKGQLGMGSLSPYEFGPTSLSSTLTFTAVTSGGEHSCAIVSSTQAAVCWGSSGIGELGDGNPGNLGGPLQQSSPVAVSGGFSWASIGAGKEHTCAVTTTGAAMCWGSNYHGEIGIGASSAPQPTPAAVNTPLSPAFATTFSGPDAYGTCWLRVGSLASCQGANDRGQAGIGGSSPGVTQPSSLFLTAPVPSFVRIALGTQHACAIDSSSNLWCWGDNTEGQIGFSTSTFSFLNHPLQVGTYKFTSVTAGGSHSCALTSVGDVYCWGKNDRGQLGIGSHGPSASTSTPMLIIP